MPSRLETPVLTVDVGLIHKVDTRNVENLFSMWTVFSRCAGSLEEGRRLENLSWRLWNRETFCCAPGEANATTPAISIAARSSDGRYSADIPDLSRSIDSLADEEAIEFDSAEANSTSAPMNITRPRVRRQDSSSVRSRGRERHITPDDLEKMVITIKENKNLNEPITLKISASLTPIAEAPTVGQTTTTVVPVISEATSSSGDAVSDASSPPVLHSDSASGTSERSTTSVVRGFSPSHISSSYRSTPLLNAPTSMPKSLLTTPSRAPLPKKHTVFALGGSSQSGDDSFNEPSALEVRVLSCMQAAKKSAVFTCGGSSGEDESSLRENIATVQPHRSSQVEKLRAPALTLKKAQTSFKGPIATHTIHEDRVMDDDVFETDEEDDIDESAIDDDDDSSDWEDSNEDSGKSSIDDKTFFQRVDSRPNLTSRRSLITTMLNESDRAAALVNQASKSVPAMKRSRTSSPNGPSLAASPDSDDNSPLMMKGLRPGQDIPRSGAKPILQTTNNVTPHQAFSPKTTRRNMLQTELTASLRRHLLWERQQKNQTASAVLKRRHTAHDVSNLKQYPDKVHMSTQVEDKDNYGSWNQYFGTGLGDFHSKGW